MPSCRPTTIRILAFVTILIVTAAGCSSIYYRTMKKFGWEKRDLLVDRVKDARKSQEEAQKEFKTTLERFREIVAFEGGSLEEKYKKLHDQLKRNEDRAKNVEDRIDAVRDVSRDLFREWQEELGKYSDRQMRTESERQLRETRARTDALIASMTSAQKRIEPVLKPLRDRVLFLKHNLNARALGALTKELGGVTSEVDALVADLQKSIAEADAFLADMQKAKQADQS
jgi:flagellar basal body-associated protein FliL